MLPIQSKCGKGRDVMGRDQRKKEYNRIRADTGQHQRILATGLVLGVLAFVPIGVRLSNLMIGDFHYYTDLALRNQTRTTQVTANRGYIYDRNMNILACSQSVENIYLDPHELKQSKADLEAIGKDLGQILNLDPLWICEQGKDITKRYKQIAARVDEQTAEQIRSYILENQIVNAILEECHRRLHSLMLKESKCASKPLVAACGT